MYVCLQHVIYSRGFVFLFIRQARSFKTGTCSDSC